LSLMTLAAASHSTFAHVDGPGVMMGFGPGMCHNVSCEHSSGVPHGKADEAF
jgi:hypothetical protein